MQGRFVRAVEHDRPSEQRQLEKDDYSKSLARAVELDRPSESVDVRKKIYTSMSR